MNKIVQFFLPKEEANYFNQLKTNFFVRICYFGIILMALYLVTDFIVESENALISLLSKLFTMLLVIASLFILKFKGIDIAGNVFTTSMLVVLLVFVNIIPSNISPIYKYLQGFYSIFAYLILGVLYATRPYIIVNSILILISSTHVYLNAVANYSEDYGMYTTSYINHTFIVISVTLIVFYANKFTHAAMLKANEEIKIREQKNYELLASEEEIRASNEELVATTNALVSANEELRLAIIRAEESDRLKTEFLNNMSHEVRTPMNGIIGFSQLLEDVNIDRVTLNNYTTIIQNSSNQLLSIIDNIIEVSKLGTKQVPVVENELNLNAFMTDLYKVFEIEANEKHLGILLNTDLPDSDCSFLMDENKLYKILANIIENAIKFTNEGRIEMGYHFNSNQKAIDFYVKDTGIGIEKEKQEIVFNKFIQADPYLGRQYGGLGLGLAIAKENTELLGGKITLESTTGVGSVFGVTLPIKFAVQAI